MEDEKQGEGHYTSPAKIKEHKSADKTDVKKLSAKDFDNQFQCPETYSDQNESREAFGRSAEWFFSHNTTDSDTPDQKAEKFKEFRMQLLAKHHCKVASDNTATNTRQKYTIPTYQTKVACQNDVACIKAEKLMKGYIKQLWGTLADEVKEMCLNGSREANNIFYFKLFECLAYEQKQVNN